ncbi:hypothetical protein [uncultured Mediterranean phage]|nr:hypothetical protein [uncultured Mediterranean phage]
MKEVTNMDSFPYAAWRLLKGVDPVDGSCAIRGSYMATKCKREGAKGPEFEALYDAELALKDWLYDNYKRVNSNTLQGSEK